MEDIMKDTIIKKLNERYTLEKREMGELGKIHKGMFQFDSEAYEIKDIGNLFIMDMKAMLGLMKMETIVITPLMKDLSFCNLDAVKAAGNYTGMFEMYDTALKVTDLSSFDTIRKKYSDLPDYQAESRWYDEYRLSSCIAKKGKKIDVETEAMLEECLDLYLDLLDKVPSCDPNKKKEKTAIYVNRLINEGGAAVDSMNKLIGKELTSKLIKEFMYHID